jgi:hypothetical protein
MWINSKYIYVNQHIISSLEARHPSPIQHPIVFPFTAW